MFIFLVNHSENFVDPQCMEHTNTIEAVCTWNGIKQNVTARHRNVKLRADGQDEDGFESLINTILEDHHEDGHRRGRRRRIDDSSDE
ncbi:hypothetical protein O0I10_006688 [Lichtheimia ornata]|uniref:Uncharacterized protein n=1 Tax=Lichtheimia ornata TaxID=688661 RepID=A0AAD7XYG4_9FUNG|nr:uncharacterized protein O0I10_006688 [Lichtheimia ornata]KAJ8657623.1 hypothetical protein O0I10_006688 [Lichtheimia ornata]